jgi:hypothetical protein
VEKVYGMVRLLLSGPYTPPTSRKTQEGPIPSANSLSEALPPHPSEPSTKAAKTQTPLKPPQEAITRKKAPLIISNQEPSQEALILREATLISINL